MNGTIDLNKLSVFVRVVESRGFTSAARALGVPKSSVSRAVAQLEESLGVRLLQRTTRTLALSEAGLALYDRASRALVELGDAASAAADMDGSPQGTVRLTAPVDLGVAILADLIVEFCAAHPGIRIETTLTARYVDLVEEGVDLALRAGKLADSSLVARKLATTEGALFASPKYLKKRGTPTRVPELASHDCVLFRPQQGRVTWALTGPRGEESVDVTGPIGADDFSFVRRVVLSGAGIGVMPSFQCLSEVESGKLVRVLPTHVARFGALHLVHPSARHLPQRVQLFRDFLVERLGGAALSIESCKKQKTASAE
jgi:DNA-binding transcriptional LysR family regulator